MSLFLSTLSLRRATRVDFFLRALYHYFYPRSPCGERHLGAGQQNYLRGNFYPRSPCGERPCRAEISESQHRHFYPRSPCGERPWARGSRITYVEISIHALLAESDLSMAAVC